MTNVNNLRLPYGKPLKPTDAENLPDVRLGWTQLGLSQQMVFIYIHQPESVVMTFLGLNRGNSDSSPADDSSSANGASVAVQRLDKSLTDASFADCVATSRGIRHFMGNSVFVLFFHSHTFDFLVWNECIYSLF